MFKIGPSPRGTGLGLVAVCDIPKGTPIVSEQPVFQVPRRIVDLPADAAGEALLRSALDALGEPERRQFDALTGLNAHDKLVRNCSTLDLAVDQVGVFFSFARVNHSCRPNAINMVDKDDATIVAQKDIKTGEEIAINYLLPAGDILLDRKGRMASLASKQLENGLEPWECICDLCASAESEIAASDARRTKMGSLKARFMAGDGVETILPLLELGAAEGLSEYHALGEDGLRRLNWLVTGVRMPGTARLDSDTNALNFPVGSRVALFRLVARADLNGRTGRVVSSFCKSSRRIGVVLDCENDAGGGAAASKSPIALKLSNIMRLPDK